MSEHEFENYLRLLGGLLKLGPKQRTLIAGEFRDHMEERLQDLMGQGLQRQRAIAIALEEFGEAAALAADLTRIGKQRTRRWIMRVTIGSITAAAAAIFVAMTLWPSTPVGIAPQAAVAQQSFQRPLAESSRASVGRLAAVKKPAPASEEERNAATLAKLTDPIDVDFQDTPLNEAMQQVAQQIGVQLFFDKTSMDDEAIGTDTPVTIQLQDVPVDTLFDLMLGQLGLGYRIRSGILVVATQLEVQESIDIRVYDVRDLLSADQSAVRVKGDVVRGGYGEAGYGGRGGGGYGGEGIGGRGGYGQGGAGGRGGYGDGRGGGYGRGGEGGVDGRGGGGYGEGGIAMQSRIDRPVDTAALYQLSRLAERVSEILTSPKADQADALGAARRVVELSHRLLEASDGKLLSIITKTVEPDSWETVGGAGSIVEYKGALIVSQTQDVHRKLQGLLEGLRKVAQASHAPVAAKSGLRRAASTRRRVPVALGETGASGDPFGGSPRGTRDTRRVSRPHIPDLFEDSADAPAADAEKPDAVQRDDFGGAIGGDAEEGSKSDEVDTPVDDLFSPAAGDRSGQPPGDDG